MTPMPDDTTAASPRSAPSTGLGLRRGLRLRCPACGDGPLFARYLKPHATCARCGLQLDEFRSDDAPPYFTILIVGHIVIPGMLLLEQIEHPPSWLHIVLWVPLTLALTLLFLPRIKGAVIGFQWAQRIRG
jgi:uncharacterized protein (DUF983 family)